MWQLIYLLFLMSAMFWSGFSIGKRQCLDNAQTARSAPEAAPAGGIQH